VSTATPGHSLHVLLVTEHFPPRTGGRASLLRELVRNLPGERTTVSTPPARGARTIDRTFPGRIRRAPAWPFRSPRVDLALWRRDLGKMCRSIRPGLIVASGGETEAALAREVSLDLDIPYVLHLEAPELVRIRTELRDGGPAESHARELLADCAGIVVGGSSCRLAAYKLGVYPDRLDVVRPGVDTDRFQPGEKPARLLEELGSPRGPMVLTVVGRSAAHDLPTLLRALGSLRHQRRGAMLIAIGTDGAEHGDVVREAGVEDAVRFVPSVPDAEMPDWYRAADVFVIAHRSERSADEVAGIPVALIEAMACGRPIVGTKSAAIEEIARADEEALLVEPEAHAKLAKSVLGLVRSPETAAELASRARTRAESDFGAARYGRDFREYLEVLYFRRLGRGTLEPRSEPAVPAAAPAT
jgi:phosphatidylinositol alpha-1,6-mannosyltransferase